MKRDVDPRRAGKVSLGGRTVQRRLLLRRVAGQVPLRIRWELEIFQKMGVAPPDLFERLTDNLALAVARAFSVQEDEVAILLLRQHRLMLRFAYPFILYAEKINTFPVSATSIAGKVLQAGRGRIDNDLPRIKHLDVYERIRIKEDRPLEIQKMVSAPLLIPWGQALGVMQVSRKGRSSKDAGPNFSTFDLVKLNDLSRWLSPYIRRVVPADF
ncbi:MAG: hypothetical protein ACE5IQ_00155 [Candidatus Methylomirabilales bacterium]